MTSVIKCERCGVMTDNHIAVSMRYGSTITGTFKLCKRCGTSVFDTFVSSVTSDIRAAS